MTGGPWVVLLSGSSSSGKSTLGRALLPLLDGPAVLIEADRAFPTVHGWPEDGRLEPPIVVLHRNAADWWRAGAHVVLDGSLPYGDDALRSRCLEELPTEATHVVEVRCDLGELRRRETSRPDARPLGWAEQQAPDVNRGLDVLLTVDTTTGVPTVLARRVLQALAAASDPV